MKALTAELQQSRPLHLKSLVYLLAHCQGVKWQIGNAAVRVSICDRYQSSTGFLGLRFSSPGVFGQ